MDVEERCEECGSLRGSNIYCWSCGEKLPPYQHGITKQSTDLDKAKPKTLGSPPKPKRTPKRTRNKNGRFRKKRSDAGKPRSKKNE